MIRPWLRTACSACVRSAPPSESACKANRQFSSVQFSSVTL